MRDSVVGLLERLHQYRQQVAEAYHHGSIQRTDDNRKAVEVLHQHRVLVPHTHDEYRLHSSLRRFLDSTLNTQRMVHGSADIGAIFQRIEVLVDNYVAAFHEGRQDEADVLEDEIASAVFEITDSLQEFLTSLQASIATRFGAVSSFAAKRRQNEFYLDVTHRLVETLKALHFSDIEARVAPFDRLADLFRIQIFRQLPVFRDALQSVYDTLRRFLFEFRQVEERARSLHAMWLYLRRNPDYEPNAWDQAPQVPPWLTRAAGILLTTYPDVLDEGCEEVLASFAQSLPSASGQASRRRQPGTLAPSGEPPAVRVVRRPYMRALLRLLAEAKVSDQPLSARRWRHERAPDLPILDGLWIEVVLDYVAKGSAAARGLPYRIIAEEPQAPFSGGNLRVHDIEVGACKSA